MLSNKGEKMNLEGNEEGFLEIKKTFVEQGYEILHESQQNKKRDLFLIISKDGITEKIYCKYRREYFKSFDFQFAEQNGAGESINQEILQKCFAYQTDKIVFVYKTGEIRWCYPMQIKNYAESNNTIRTQNEKEITYCIPIELMEMLKP